MTFIGPEDDISREAQDRVIAQDVREWVSDSKGWFWKGRMDGDLQITTKKDRKASLAEVGRLLKLDRLIHHKTESGRYRKRDIDIEEITWWEASGKDIPIRWPLEVERVVKFFPGNIAIITALADEGKSAWIFDFIRKALEDIDALKEWFDPIRKDGEYPERIIQVLDSEKGLEELNERLLKMEDMDRDDMKRYVGYFEKSVNQQDAIAPDSINIIDFLEIHENYSEVGGIIREIHDNLNKGIAIVAMQKKSRESDFALGSWRSLEKPRLYISLKRDFNENCNVMKIIKAKNRRTGRDPNGMIAKYKLVQGNKFVVTRPLEDEYFDKGWK